MRELLFSGYFRKIFNYFGDLDIMEVFDLEGLLKKENFRILFVNGDFRLFYGRDVDRIRSEGYAVFEINVSQYESFDGFITKFFEINPNYVVFNFRSFEKGSHLALELSYVLKKEKVSPVIEVSSSWDYDIQSKRASLMLARRYWEYEFPEFAKRIASARPYRQFGQIFRILNHNLNNLWVSHTIATGDEKLFDLIIFMYGLAVGQGNQRELVARLEGIYSLIYGEDLKDAGYHSDGSANEFTGN